MDHSVSRIDCSILRPVPSPHRRLSTVTERLALAYRSLKGYRYYYCLDKGDVCAYLFLKHDFLGHYSFMSKSDMLINPYKTLPTHRKQGYAAALLRAAVSDAAENGIRVYAVVTSDNLASQKALERNGFSRIGYAVHSAGKFGRSRLVFTETETRLLLYATLPVNA